MNNKKGFTLIELLAVIVIMGILLSVAVPSIISIAKKQKLNLKEKKLDLLVEAAEEYLMDNKDAYYSVTSDSTYFKIKEFSGEKNLCVETSKLKDEGYVEDISDPTEEGQDINVCIYVKIVTTSSGKKVYKSSLNPITKKNS